MPAFGLEDNHFKIIPPAQIISEVGTITLATISLWSVEELKRIGWLDNSIIDLLYKLGSTGVWTAREQSADGTGPTELQIAFRNATFAKTNSTYNLFDFGAQTALPAYYAQRRCAVIPITVGGGGATADTVIVPALAGYKSCCRILGIISSITEAATVLDFEDEDNTDLEGNLSGGFAMNFTASTMNSQLTNVLLRGTVAAKSAEVDVTSFGAGGTILIYLEYWYEA